MYIYICIYVYKSSRTTILFSYKFKILSGKKKTLFSSDVSTCVYFDLRTILSTVNLQDYIE